MASLRPMAVPQDENDVAYGHRVKFDGSNDGPGFATRKGLGGQQWAGGGLGGAKTPGKGLASGRKALGNLTNRTGMKFLRPTTIGIVVLIASRCRWPVCLL